jgi:hypothetical protein
MAPLLRLGDKPFFNRFLHRQSPGTKRMCNDETTGGKFEVVYSSFMAKGCAKAWVSPCGSSSKRHCHDQVAGKVAALRNFFWRSEGHLSATSSSKMRRQCLIALQLIPLVSLTGFVFRS